MAAATLSPAGFPSSAFPESGGEGFTSESDSGSESDEMRANGTQVRDAMVKYYLTDWSRSCIARACSLTGPVLFCVRVE